MRKVLAVVLLVSLCGCGTLQKLGLQDDVVESAIKLAINQAIAAEGLSGVVPDGAVDEVIEIIKAEDRLKEIAESVASNAMADEDIANRVAELLKDQDLLKLVK